MLSGCREAVVMAPSSFGKFDQHSLQSQGHPSSTAVDGQIRRRRRPMSMVHRVSTPINNNKHHVNRLYVHEKYGMEKSREPMTLATTVDEFVHR
jgi:hypothetical protein